MRLGATLTALMFGAVFLASVLNQLGMPRWAVFVARWDRWTLLPFWAFFAPDPAFAGIHLVFRDRGPIVWTGWTEVRLPDSNGWRWIWNPGRHERKALHDLLNGLSSTAAEFKEPATLAFSTCHLGLLAWVVTQPRLSAASQSRQFALMQTIGHGEARILDIVFMSKEFALD